jgi:hypothetical protein
MPKNFRQIPAEVRQRLETFALDDVVVAVGKQLRAQDVQRYAHLGLRVENDRLSFLGLSYPTPVQASTQKLTSKGRRSCAKTFQ